MVIPGLRRFTAELAARAFYIWEDGLNVEPEAAPRISAGSGAPSAADADGSTYHRTDGAAGTTLYARVSSAWAAMAPASWVATQLVTCTVSVGTEAANVIALTINVTDLAGNAVSRSQRLIVTVYEATMIEAVAAAFTMADGGAGTIVSTTANARIIFDTDATGDAVIDLTDAAGASGKTVYITVEPCPLSGTNTYGNPVLATATFD